MRDGKLGMVDISSASVTVFKLSFVDVEVDTEGAVAVGSEAVGALSEAADVVGVESGRAVAGAAVTSVLMAGTVAVGTTAVGSLPQAAKEMLRAPSIVAVPMRLNSVFKEDLLK